MRIKGDNQRSAWYQAFRQLSLHVAVTVTYLAGRQCLKVVTYAELIDEKSFMFFR